MLTEAGLKPSSSRVLEKIRATIPAALAVVLLFQAMAGLDGVGAQSAVDYDADDDGLIEIEWLEQLDAVRWDLDGDGLTDDDVDAERYLAAFPYAAEYMGCPDRCEGYELARDLDFKSAGSYAAGTVNGKWTSGNGWLPIGVNNSFEATFEGNERTIANLYINRKSDNQPDAIGLFYVSHGNIDRIGLVNIDVSGTNFVGGLVGDNGGNISSSYATGSVSGGEKVGGLVGYVGSGSITSSYATGSVSGTRAGGLIGENQGNVSSCYADVIVSARENSGGLLGLNTGDVRYSYATGRVSSQGEGFAAAGGLVGWNSGSISSSYASGNISGGDAGGLIGKQASGSVIYSYAIGSVSSNQYAGGLVGVNARSDITASYATGDVVGNVVGALAGNNGGRITASYATGSASGKEITGGFVGSNGGSIKTSYTTSSVRESGSEHIVPVGGFVGLNEGEIIESYWRREPPVNYAGIGDGNADGVRGFAAQQLQQPTDHTGIYADWLTDFDNADGDYDETTGTDDFWDFGTSRDYPALKMDLDGDGVATWWEGGRQHGRVEPTPTPTPTATPTPTPTATATHTPTPTITPTSTNTPIPTETPTATATLTSTASPTQTPTMTETDTPVPTATAIQTAVPTETPVPTSTPGPTAMPVPPTQTPVIIVITATPEADALSGGGCNSVGVVPVGVGAANLLLLVAPLGIIGGVRWRRKLYNLKANHTVQ